MRALVKPSTEPYDEVMPESSWGAWTLEHLDYYTEFYGYTLIENYEPPESVNVEME